MTVANETNRSGPYLGNGVVKSFDYGFRILDQAHLRVIKADAEGNETTLVLAADYTVSGVGAPGGGSIVTTVAPAAGQTITILRNIPFTQETDLENQGAYYAETVEDALDAAAMRDQQLQEQLNRAVKVPVSADDPDGQLSKDLAEGILRLYESADNVDTVAGISEDVTTVAGLSDDIALIGNHPEIITGTASGLILSEKLFYGNGVTTEWVLDRHPADDESVLVWVGGAIQSTSDYAVDGNVLLITPAVASGVVIRTLVLATVTAQQILDLLSQAVAAKDAAFSVLSQIYQLVGSVTTSTYEFAVGGAVQSVDLHNTEITLDHIVSVSLDGVQQHKSTLSMTGGVLTPASGSWPDGYLQVIAGSALPIGVTAAVPLVGSVTDASVAPDADISPSKLRPLAINNDNIAPDAGIDASKISIIRAPYLPRSVGDKLSDVVSLRDYGAKGDGAYDNKGAWDDAIADILTRPRGGTIRVPAGRFASGEQVVFPKTTGKFITIAGDGNGAVLDVTGTVNEAFYVGGATSGGGTGFRAQDLTVVGDSATTHKAFRLENANGAQFENVILESMRDGFRMTASYAVSFVNMQCLDIGGTTVYSDTSAHNLIIDRFKAYNAGVAAAGAFLWLDGHTDNVVIQNSAFEYCRQVFNFSQGSSSTRFTGNYVEYCTTDPFGFGTGVYGLEMTGNWLALGTAFSFNNWFGGKFGRNRLYDQAVSWGASCRDVSTGGNRISGASVFNPASAIAVSAFYNGSAAGARPVTYFKDDNGFVHLSGELVVGANGNTSFVMPLGYRPTWQSANPRFPSLSTVDNSNAYVIVDSSNGNVVPTCAGNHTITLDGINYKAE